MQLKYIMRSKTRYCCLWLLLLTCAGSCKKFIEIGLPADQLITSSVFKTDATATAAIVGIYGNMIGNFGLTGKNPNITVLGGLSADELDNYSSDQAQAVFYTNNLTALTGYANTYFWGRLYEFIYDANSALEGLAGSTGISESLKKQLEGEAKFIRAYCHFYLVNLFGDVPLVTSTDYKLNNIAVRTPQQEVYRQIIKDLADAQDLMVDDYSYSNDEKVRPNKSAARALLARVYLYTKDWADAEAAATAVIGNPAYSLETDLNAVFLKNSAEAIWQIMPVTNMTNSWDGVVFILTGDPLIVAASPHLIDAFETDDKRKTDWIGSIAGGTQTYYYPYKYKVKYSETVTEYPVMLRLAEQYLIRAEARAQLNKITEAQEDLNAIRNRAGLPNTIANDQASLLSAIMHERQVELFTEFGQRWLDLKRTGLADAVLAPIKGDNWQTTDQWYPIPITEIQKNPHLTQNDGY